MERVNFTQYDEYPQAMLAYLRNYGPHFNKKLCEFAASHMKKMGPEGNEKKIVPYSKEKVEQLMHVYSVTVDNAQLYDCVFVANMCKADFLGTSIIDEGILQCM